MDSSNKLIDLIRDISKESTSSIDRSVICYVDSVNIDDTLNIRLPSDINNIIKNIPNNSAYLFQSGDYAVLYKIGNKLNNSFVISKITKSPPDIQRNNIISKEDVIIPSGASSDNGTSVYVNNIKKNRIDFISDPQTQINNKLSFDGNGSNVTVDFIEASNEPIQNIDSGSNLSELFGITKQWLAALKPVALSGSYNDLTDTPIIPTVNNGKLTINQNSVKKGDFTANQSSDTTINILTPTKTSDLINDGDGTSDFATESFVNSSIATNTAYFRGTYNIITDLGLTTSATEEQISSALANKMASLSITPTNNDYAYVAYPDATDPTQYVKYDRYKYDSADDEWGYEYTLNNSSFTAAQWDAINSGITSGDVSQIITNKNDISGIKDGTIINSFSGVESALSGKQDTLTFDNVPTQNSANPVKSGGVYNATFSRVYRSIAEVSSSLTSISTMIDLINAMTNNSVLVCQPGSYTALIPTNADNRGVLEVYRADNENRANARYTVGSTTDSKMWYGEYHTASSINYWNWREVADVSDIPSISQTQNTSTTSVPSDRLLKESTFARVYRTFYDDLGITLSSSTTMAQVCGEMVDNSEAYLQKTSAGGVDIATKFPTATNGTLHILRWNSTRTSLEYFPADNSVIKYIGYYNTNLSPAFTGWKQVANVENLSNPNMIANSNFKCNAKKLSTYTGSGNTNTTVNNWYLTTGAVMTVLENGISYTAQNAWTGLYQFIENSKSLQSQTVTISAKVKCAESPVQVSIRYGTKDSTSPINYVRSSTALSDYSILSCRCELPSLTTDQFYKCVVENTTANATMYVEWVKVEIGDICTEYTPPIYEVEQWGAANLSDLAKTNLMFNPDFRINTKGLQIYGSSTETVQYPTSIETVNGWWFGRDYNGTFNVSTKTLTVGSNGTYAILIGNTEIPITSLEGKTLTISVNVVNDETYNAYLGIGYGTANSTNYTQLNTNVGSKESGLMKTTVTIPSGLSSTNVLKVRLYKNAGFIQIVDGFHLELGDIVTEYTPPVYEIEQWGAANLSDLAKPNLIYNSDFVINTRGQPQYSISSNGPIETVDGLLLYYYSSPTLTVKSGGGVSVSGTATGGNNFICRHNILNYANLAGKTVTLTIKLSNITGTGLKVRTSSTSSGTYSSTITSDIIFTNTFNISATPTELAVSLTTASSGAYSFDIDWWKLELGDIPTEFTPTTIPIEQGALYAYNNAINITGLTLSLNDLNFSSGYPYCRRYICKTTGGSSNISNKPTGDAAFILDVNLIRYNTTSDYVVRQTYAYVSNIDIVFVRSCTNGTWSSWCASPYRRIVPICASSGGSANKTVPQAVYTAQAGNLISIYFVNANTAANATLNINSTGAYYIYVNGSATTGASGNLPAGWHTFYFDGEHYLTGIHSLPTESVNAVAWTDVNTTFPLSSASASDSKVLSEKAVYTEAVALEDKISKCAHLNGSWTQIKQYNQAFTSGFTLGIGTYEFYLNCPMYSANGYAWQYGTMTVWDLNIAYDILSTRFNLFHTAAYDIFICRDTNGSLSIVDKYGTNNNAQSIMVYYRKL